MVSIEKVEQIQLVESTLTDAGTEHRCRWYIETDTPTASDHAYGLARLNHGNGPQLPTLGDGLAVEKGIVQKDPGDIAAWVGGGSDRYGDGSALALNINTVEASPAAKTKFHCTVRWTQPEANVIREEVNTSPLVRESKRWIEWNVYTEETQEAYFNPTAGPLTTKGIWRNTLIDPFPPTELQWMRAVIVAEIAVTDPSISVQLNQIYENTVNDKVWNVLGLSVARHHARFIRSECSKLQTWRNSTRPEDPEVKFYWQQTRVEVGRNPYYTTQLNRGPRAKQTRDYGPIGSEEVISGLDALGHPIPEDTLLAQDGTELPVGQDPIEYTYCIFDEADYDAL